MNDNNDKTYGVLLTDAQEIKIIEIRPNEEVFDCGRRAIGCEWIELVEPDTLSDQNLVMMIDEEAKLKAGGKYVNCIASFTYESQIHGDMIIGNAVIVKAGEEELEMLSQEEAIEIASQMGAIRGEAIQTIAAAVNPKPSIIDTLHPKENSQDQRQPCRGNRTER